MPASNVSRVRSEGFSKNMTICLPASTPRKSAGRRFSMAVRLKRERISAGERSCTDTRSRGAIGSGTRFGGCAFGTSIFARSNNAMGSFLICVFISLRFGKIRDLVAIALRQLANASGERAGFFSVGCGDEHGVVPSEGADHF